MRLYIDIITTEQLLGTLYSQILDDVHALASAIISLARISLSILVGKWRTHCCHDCLAHPVLGCDKLDVAVLTILLGNDSLSDFVIHCSYFV